MFKGIRNIASEIRSEISSDHSSQSQSQSPSTSRTRRFRTSLDGGSSNNGNTEKVHHFRKYKNKTEIEQDGNTEDDTVVNRALIKFYKQQGKQLPSFLMGNIPQSQSKSDIQVQSQVQSQVQVQSSPPPIRRATTELRNDQIPIRRQEIQQSPPPRQKLQHSMTQPAIEVKKTDINSQSQSQSQSPPPLLKRNTSRFQSRFSGNSSSTTTGQSNSRFGRRVQ